MQTGTYRQQRTAPSTGTTRLPMLAVAITGMFAAQTKESTQKKYVDIVAAHSTQNVNEKKHKKKGGEKHRPANPLRNTTLHSEQKGPCQCIWQQTQHSMYNSETAEFSAAQTGTETPECVIKTARTCFNHQQKKREKKTNVVNQSRRTTVQHGKASITASGDTHSSGATAGSTAQLSAARMKMYAHQRVIILFYRHPVRKKRQH